MPQIVMIDSGPCIALFNRDDEFHERALRFLRNTKAELLSTLAVVTEVMFVLDFSPRAQRDFLTWVSAGGVQLVEPERTDFPRVIELMEKYADLRMDFTDALLVASCERLRIKHVASVDRDCAIYRFKGKGKFINVFPAQR